MHAFLITSAHVASICATCTTTQFRFRVDCVTRTFRENGNLRSPRRLSLIRIDVRQVIPRLSRERRATASRSKAEARSRWTTRLYMRLSKQLFLSFRETSLEIISGRGFRAIRISVSRNFPITSRTSRSLTFNWNEKPLESRGFPEGNVTSLT